MRRGRGSKRPTYQDTQVSAELRPTVEHRNKYSQLNLSDFKYKMRIKLLIFSLTAKQHCMLLKLSESPFCGLSSNPYSFFIQSFSTELPAVPASMVPMLYAQFKFLTHTETVCCGPSHLWLKESRWVQLPEWMCTGTHSTKLTAVYQPTWILCRISSWACLRTCTISNTSTNTDSVFIIHRCQISSYAYLCWK